MPDLVDAGVRAYLLQLSLPADEVLEKVRRRSKTDNVSALEALTARFLHVLATAIGARRILEIGTGYGYSGTVLAQAMPADGLLFTFERDRERADVAREHFVEAGVGSRVNVMIGDANRLLYKVAGPFDMILQDGDKLGYAPMLDRIVSLLRPGGLLVSDNILWGGDVVAGFNSAPLHDEATVEAIADYNRKLSADARLTTAFLSIGDGVAVSVRKD